MHKGCGDGPDGDAGVAGAPRFSRFREIASRARSSRGSARLHFLKCRYDSRQQPGEMF